jgi:hypothetical protein
MYQPNKKNLSNSQLKFIASGYYSTNKFRSTLPSSNNTKKSLERGVNYENKFCKEEMRSKYYAEGKN